MSVPPAKEHAVARQVVIMERTFAVGWKTLLIAVALPGLYGCTDPADVRQVPPPTPDSATPQQVPSRAETPEQAPEGISLQVADAAEYHDLLASHRGNVVLADFWATWCAPCVAQFRHTVDLHEEFDDQGLAVISVSLDQPENAPTVRKFLEAQGAHFDNLVSQYGGSPKSVEAFDIPGGAVPHYKLYDRDGKLRHSFSVDPVAERQFTPDDVRRQVEELLSEKAPASN